ncbi:DUF411 domain-containing protein [Pseudothioclava arenosa]|uniref:Metal-binding protein n=1 Tax=Pseudothioclava arenosa TaxID=1795308 RepID=A0A2A4CMS8_9RHOB|nr:DUF411 domain-containing protein [Pseudothioclava arenosa]PCD75767.1 metal-binding protein [Pseudothioclava arenosa]
MTQALVSRRRLLRLAAGASVLPALPLYAASAPAIHVVKDPDCGCCGAWMEVLARDGFAVTQELRPYDALQAYKAEMGVPEGLASCHTAMIEGYVIEGHVPPADILRLLDERPEAIGLSVPGMPYGSPGMGPESERDAYQVILFRRDGTGEIFASYGAA